MSLQKKQLEEYFLGVYTALNDQQRQAVDSLEGPVMVIAGPGTGKTQILAARIAKILMETHATPENILCLTYTDAGVVAMRKRLRAFIGADAFRVNIYSYHAFCNDVIQHNLSYFEKSALDPVSDLERIEYLRSIIDSFPKGHPLKRYRGDVYYDVPNLANLFSTMKSEGWEPAWLKERIAEYLAQIETSDEYRYKTSRVGRWQAGDLKPDYYTQVKRMEKLTAAVDEFDHYQDLMKQNDRYDFDDMINWVIKAFKEDENLLALYQERFQYILVDEFQDSSGTQNRIVELLIRYWEQPNIFVVGDDDQSIYRFQGANVENMLNFANQYINDLKTIVLTNNYRSTQPILDVSMALISNNQERLVNQLPGLSKDLVAANDKINQLQDKPAIVEYNSMAEEMAGISLRVSKLCKQGVDPGKIAVIYAQNKYGDELKRYFAVKEIPVYSKRQINLLDQPFIRKFVSILRYLHEELDAPYGGDERLFEILHYDFFNIPPIEIAKITVEVNRQRFKGEMTSIRKSLTDRAKRPGTDLFDPGLPESLLQTSQALEQLIADVPNVTIQQLVENVIRRTGVLGYILKHEQKTMLMQYLSGFFDFVKEENRRKPRLTLRELINLLDVMVKEKIALSLVQLTGNDKGVNLLTAHGSKGLEFEYVFLAGANSNLWEKKGKPNGGFTIPGNVFTSGQRGDDLEELRRVFYVAITRAEISLTISYSRFHDDMREREPSRFIAEIQDKYDLTVDKISISDGDMFAFKSVMLEGKSPVLAEMEDDLISQLLEKFVMNVTALNNYLQCPLRFYYQNLIRIPSGKNEALTFGSAIHFALEKLFSKMRKDNGVFPPAEVVVSDFSWFMNRNRESFTQEAFDRRMEQGSIIIPEYYDKYILTWNKTIVTEININTVVRDVPVKGKMDKLEFHGNDVNIVDYKTGDSTRAKEKLLPPNDKNNQGGDYWRQAVFYKLLLDNYPLKNWNAVSAEFDFIEPDTDGKYQKTAIRFSEPDLETVRQQIAETWEKIQHRDFYTGCGKPECEWCNFVKDNRLYVRLEPQEEED